MYRKKCPAAMINFKKIRQIRNYLSKEATETLLLGLVISHIDYANSLFMGVPDMVIKPRQRFQNMCAKVVLGLNKYDSITEALYTLHWLPIRARIEYKVICICYQCIHGNAPEYLKCLLRSLILDLCVIVNYTIQQTKNIC